MQSIAGLSPDWLVTVPEPDPASLTINANVCVLVLNVAVTFCTWLIVTVHVPVAFVQAPLQPAKFDPLAGVAVNVTEVPAL